MVKKLKMPGNQQHQSDDTKTFICEWCGKHKDFTKEEITKQKKFDPDLKKEGVDYYIECPFCKGGYMFSQEDVVFRELATGLFNE